MIYCNQLKEDMSMKRWVNAANRYIADMKICDVALLKICVCAAGVLWGMAIPRKHKKVTVFFTTAVFAATYVLVMVPFLERLTDEK